MRRIKPVLALFLAVLLVLNVQAKPARAVAPVVMWVAGTVGAAVGDVVLGKASDLIRDQLERNWKLPAYERTALQKGFAIARKTPSGWVKAGVTAGAISFVAGSLIGAFLGRKPSVALNPGQTTPHYQPSIVQYASTKTSYWDVPQTLPPPRYYPPPDNEVQAVDGVPLTIFAVKPENGAFRMRAKLGDDGCGGPKYKIKAWHAGQYGGENGGTYTVTEGTSQYEWQPDGDAWDMGWPGQPMIVRVQQMACGAPVGSPVDYSYQVPESTDAQKYAPTFDKAANPEGETELRTELAGVQSAQVPDNAPIIYPVNPDDPNSELAISPDGTLPDEPTPPAGEPSLFVLSSTETSSVVGWTGVPATVVEGQNADGLRVFVDGNVLVGGDVMRASGQITVSVGNKVTRRLTLVPYVYSTKKYGSILASVEIQGATQTEPTTSPAPSTQPSTQPSTAPSTEPSTQPSAPPDVKLPGVPSWEDEFFFVRFMEKARTKFPFDWFSLGGLSYPDADLYVEFFEVRHDLNWTKLVWRGVQGVTVVGLMIALLVAL